jgi:hypothetical protein
MIFQQMMHCMLSFTHLAAQGEELAAGLQFQFTEAPQQSCQHWSIIW